MVLSGKGKNGWILCPDWVKDGISYIGRRFNGAAAKDKMDNNYIQVFAGNGELTGVLRTDLCGLADALLSED